MKNKELRDLSVADLQQKVGQLRREHLTLRVQKANQQLKNPLKLREVRRQIARILTIISEKGVVNARQS